MDINKAIKSLKRDKMLQVAMTGQVVEHKEMEGEPNVFLTGINIDTLEEEVTQMHLDDFTSLYKLHAFKEIDDKAGALKGLVDDLEKAEAAESELEASTQEEQSPSIDKSVVSDADDESEDVIE